MLTRSDRCDTAAKILRANFKIREGNTRKGAVYEYCNDPAITVGTTALAWFRTDVNRTQNDASVLFTDFDQATLATFATGTQLPGDMALQVSLSGTSSVARQISPDAFTRGVVRLSVTTSTAVAQLSSTPAGAPQFFLDPDTFFEVEFRAAGPSALSDATNTYRVIMGLADNALATANNGSYIEYTQTTDTHWLCVTKAAGVATSVASSRTVTASTFDRFMMRKYAGESKIHFYVNNVEVGTGNTTNVPTAVALGLIFAIVKSAGSAAQTWDLDSIRVMQAWPKGRAA